MSGTNSMNRFVENTANWKPILTLNFFSKDKAKQQKAKTADIASAIEEVEGRAKPLTGEDGWVDSVFYYGAEERAFEEFRQISSGISFMGSDFH